MVSVAQRYSEFLSNEVKRGSLHYVELYLAQGADVNFRDENGQTPLHYAARKGHTETVGALIEKRAGVNAVDNDNQTPLDIAKTQGNEFYNQFIDAIAKKINSCTKELRPLNKTLEERDIPLL